LTFSVTSLAQETCKVQFSVVWKDELNNITQGLSPDDVKWFSAKVAPKYPGICYTVPSAKPWLVFYIMRNSEIRSGTRMESVPVHGIDYNGTLPATEEVFNSRTRIGRFLMQEMIGRVRPELGASTSIPGAVLATSLIVAGWAYLILTGNVTTIWPMFGIANQLLASVALALGTTIIINIGRAKYAWVTFLPLCFVTTTTLTAGFLSVRDNFWPMATGANEAIHLQGYVNTSCTVIMMVCVVIILISAARRCLMVLTGRIPALELAEA